MAEDERHKFGSREMRYKAAAVGQATGDRGLSCDSGIKSGDMFRR